MGMNSQVVKVTDVQLDEYQLTNLAIIVQKHYRDHPNRGSRGDLRELLQVLTDALEDINVNSI
jgi:hypothetical protein